MTDDLFYRPTTPPWHRVVQQAVALGYGVRPYCMWGHVAGLPAGSLTYRDLALLARKSDADSR